METTEIRELRSRIGHAIRRLRQEEGISAVKLAKILGVTQPTISRIERGSASISAENLCFLARVFSRELAFFLGERDPTIHSNEDVIRAGLVHYGARQLKAKKIIDPKKYWRTYADFLNEALNEVSDPRTAAAVAATLYIQALHDGLNKTRILATIQSEGLLANLSAILRQINSANFKLKGLQKDKERALEKLGDLEDEITRRYKPDSRMITVADISPSFVAGFINESLDDERSL